MVKCYFVNIKDNNPRNSTNIYGLHRISGCLDSPQNVGRKKQDTIPELISGEEYWTQLFFWQKLTHLFSDTLGKCLYWKYRFGLDLKIS